MKLKNPYKIEKYSNVRLEEYNMILEVDPNKIPIIVIPDTNIKTEKNYYKFLVDRENKLYGLLRHIKRSMEIDDRMSLVLMSETKELINIQSTAKNVYYQHRDNEDKLLYLHVYKENTFG